MAKMTDRQQAQPLDFVDLAVGRIEEARKNQSTELDLSSLGPTELPEAIGQLRQLQSLYLWGNQLTEVPETIGQLGHLQSLNLSNNALTEVPETIGQLSQLQSLILSDNHLYALPLSLKQLVNLKDLAW